MKGYKFNTEKQAQVAQTLLRKRLDARGENPDGKPSVTTEWVSIEQGDKFYYILGEFDELGTPEDIEIIHKL